MNGLHHDVHHFNSYDETRSLPIMLSDYSSVPFLNFAWIFGVFGFSATKYKCIRYRCNINKRYLIIEGIVAILRREKKVSKHPINYLTMTENSKPWFHSIVLKIAWFLMLPKPIQFSFILLFEFQSNKRFKQIFP